LSGGGEATPLPALSDGWYTVGGGGGATGVVEGWYNPVDAAEPAEAVELCVAIGREGAAGAVCACIGWNVVGGMEGGGAAGAVGTCIGWNVVGGMEGGGAAGAVGTCIGWNVVGACHADGDVI
jgi:hypothetical protein